MKKCVLFLACFAIFIISCKPSSTKGKWTEDEKNEAFSDIKMRWDMEPSLIGAFDAAELRFHINCTVDSLEANYDSYVSANKDVRQSKALDISRACIFITQEKFRGLTLGSGANAADSSIFENVIGNPIKIGNLEVAQYDYPTAMNWDNAKKTIALFEDGGWRLPTKNELNILYTNKDKIGGFAAGAYWSSKESDDFNAWAQIFDDGFQNYANKDYQGYVRAVRTF